MSYILMTVCGKTAIVAIIVFAILLLVKGLIGRGIWMTRTNFAITASFLVMVLSLLGVEISLCLQPGFDKKTPILMGSLLFVAFLIMGQALLCYLKRQKNGEKNERPIFRKNPK